MSLSLSRLLAVCVNGSLYVVVYFINVEERKGWDFLAAVRERNGLGAGGREDERLSTFIGGGLLASLIPNK